MHHPQQQDVVDPVCGMTVNPRSAPAESEFEGTTYYFCAPICKERFEGNPQKFVEKGEKNEHQ